MEQNKCNKCGRPMQYATEPKCNYCDACMNEYCGCKLGRIKEIEPTCDSIAVIPSITVESVEGITNLANCLVHVNDINTTFYVDDKHRVMITWAGPVDIPGYDMEHNPEGFRDQIVTDKEKNIAVIYDKHGKGYTFGIEQGYDITEIINNKLEQMAADGELQDIIQSYLDAYAMVVFDTVTDMKASEVLVDGSYARTLGYYAISDGGGTLYKITETEPSTYYETLDSGLYAQLIPENGSINVKQFGCVGDGTTDDTTKLATALTYGVTNDLKIELNGAESYLISTATSITQATKSLMIDGHNATIKISGTGKLRMISAECDTIDIRNLKFDGTGTTQDQFDETTWGNLTTYTALNLNGNNINLNNLTLSNWYGSGIRFHTNYKNVNINNIIIDNVGGHWYQNDAYDAFGDAFAFSGRTGTANINITNVKAVGKYKGSTLSRIGLAFDYAANKNDDYTNVSIENCEFINYDRGIHVENILGKMKMECNNSRFVSNVFLFNYNNNADQFMFTGNNLILDYHNATYNGSQGIYNTIFDISDSVIDCNYGTALGMFHAGGTYRNCTLNNLHSSSFNIADTIIFDNCTVNISTLTQYICYRGDIHWNHCTFNSSSFQAESRSSRSMKYASCTFNNFLPFYEAEDLNNVFYITNATLDDSQKYYIESGTIYIDNVLTSSPNISQTLPVEDISLYNYVGTRSVPAEGTISFMPTFDNTYLRPNSKYLLITMAHNSAIGVRRNGKNFDNYYYNVITTNSSSQPTIGATQTIGDPSTGGYNLTIDYTNNTLARGGTYSTYAGQWLLPYYYKDFIKNFA